MKVPLLLKQIAIRIGAILIIKVIGLIGRVALTRLVGAEGVGLYQISYSYYGLLLMIIAGGWPTVLALFTTRNASRGWVWFKVIAVLLMVWGGLLSLLSFTFSHQIADLLGNPKLYFSIQCLAPALFAVPLLSLLRGYLQGLERYSLIAMSELVEQAVRVGAMLLFIILFLVEGPLIAAGGGMLGTFAGAVASFMMLTVYFISASGSGNRKDSHEALPFSDFNSGFSWFFQTSIAISFTRLLGPLSDFLDAIIIPARLQIAGHSASEATAMFGVITGMAVIVVYVPTLVTAALSHTLTMKMVTDWKEGRLEQFFKRIAITLELGWVWGVASALFLFVYGPELSWLIFNTREAGEPIRYLSIVPLLVGLRELTTSILWAQERKKIPFAGLVTGICCAVCCHYLLVAIPGFGYAGASVGILVLEAVAVIWNVWALLEVCKSIQFLPLLVDALVIAGGMLLIYIPLHTTLGNGLIEPLQALTGMVLFCGGAGSYIILRFLYKYKIHFSS